MKDKDNDVAYAHPLNIDKKLSHAYVPEGNSRAANIKNTKEIIWFLEEFKGSNSNENDDFAMNEEFN